MYAPYMTSQMDLLKADIFTAKPETKLSLPLAVVRAYSWEILAGVPFRIALIALSYSQPFIISRAISFVVEPVTEASEDVGIELIGAAVLVYVGLAVSSSQNQ